MDQLIQYTVLATGTAALYTLLAQSILIVYRGSRILNFAAGAYVMFGAYLFHDLRERGWPVGLAAVTTVVAISLIGGLTYLVVVRPLRDASLVLRIVATLAVVIILAELAGLWQPQGGLVEAVLPERTVEVFGTDVGIDRLILLAIATALSIVLWVVYKFTTFGLATAAVSENTRAASALGWSADRIALGSWLLAGMLAGLSSVLISPVQSALDTTNLTLNVVPALAVALLANFKSFPIASVAALGLAGIQAYLNGSVVGDHPALKGVDAIVPLVAIVAVLAMQGNRIPPRGQRSERRPLLGTGILRPIPIVIALAVTIGMTWAVLPADWVPAVSLHATYALLVLSLVVVLGYAGQLSLGQVAFAGIGALIAGRLVATQGWNFGFALIVGVAGTAVAGAAFALPALRTRGVALGIVTLSLGAAVYSFLFTRTYYSPTEGGEAAADLNFGVSPEGTVIRDLKVFGIDLRQFENPETYATMCVVVLAVVSVAVVTMRRSRAGRRLIAIRTNERAAASLGISVPAAKLYAFSVSAAIAGLSGILLAFRNNVITYENDFSPLQSIYAVAFAVIGGVGSVVGATFGAMLFPGTAGAAVGRDLSAWLADMGEPRPWITALLLFGVVFAVAKRTVRNRRLRISLLAASLVAGALLADPIGTLLGNVDDAVDILPWIGALAIGAIAMAIARLVIRRTRMSTWVPLGVFVAVVVLSRIFAAETVDGWLTDSPRYLPLLGGVALIDMMLRHGDGLAITLAHAVNAARGALTRPAVDIDAVAAAAGTTETPARAGSVLEIEGMSVTFGGVRAVTDLDLVIRPGEILGLIGPNGAGKSTVVDAITGYARLSSGRILLDGEPINDVAAHRRARKGIARTFQNLELFDDITVLENLAAASDTHEMSAYLTGLVYAGTPNLSPMAINALVAFDLEADLNSQANTLPHGRRRLVAVARAVANHPKVLLLDEPAAGLDGPERQELADVVRTLVTTYGITVMVIEHDMNFIMSLCDRIAVIDFGRKIADGTPAEVQASPTVVAAYLGAADEEQAEHVVVGASESAVEQTDPETGDLVVLTEERQ